ncbi:MAG TPA: Gldg family protein [Tahibacter sp.]|uniref:GldG family protein n=1 Tax=Tahibacter sp. TaxID=2056211 RepID=UPI002C6BBB28|nr:Gldg family protein [Tahibacter sp.]HSX59404.1 Gldg family protein [Tahibacter sp.]
MAFNRKTLTGSALVILALLFVAVVLVSNVLLRGVRLDLTESNLYTLSDGTRSLLGKLEEPIQLTLYFSDRGTADTDNPSARALRAYYPRVRELLEEIAARSDGKVRLKVVDPVAYSEDEDNAVAAGIQGLPFGPAGESVFLGVYGSNSTNGEAKIPLFDPGRENLAEYDIAKLIHDLGTNKKPAVGFISSLPMTMGFDQATRQMRQPWAVYGELAQFFDLRQMNAAALKTIESDINVVVLVHPKDLGDDALYAIDQFVLRGGHLLVFVDPSAEQDQAGADPENPQAAMLADKSSDLSTLFKAWGLDYAHDKVVLDRAHALQISIAPNAPPVRHPGILGFTRKDLSADDVITANLDSINMSSVGYLELSKDSQSKLVPLIQSSDQAMSVPVDRLKFLVDPSTLLVDFKPSGQPFVLAGRLEGRFKTAFPDRKDAGHLAEAQASNAVVVFADTDILSDRLWAEVQNFFGQKVLNAFANNGDLVINAVDNLAGDSDLISIRGRATSQRPFTKVAELKRKADDSFRQKEKQLQQELGETERKLTELQSAKSQDQAMVLSAEQKAELDNFLKRKVEIRKQLREVRRQLDADIDALGTRLKFINILLVPLLLILAALGFVGWKSRRARG